MNFERPRDAMPLDEWGIHVQTDHGPWVSQARRIAGVSSFDIGGTNAFARVGEACHSPTAAIAGPLDAVDGTADPGTPAVWPISAASPAALREVAERLADHAQSTLFTEVDLGHNLAAGRAHLQHRAVIVAPDTNGACSQLRLLATGAPDVDVVSGRASAHALAIARGLRIVYPLRTEPWGVRRFFVQDPGGTIVNVLAHTA